MKFRPDAAAIGTRAPPAPTSTTSETRTLLKTKLMSMMMQTHAAPRVSASDYLPPLNNNQHNPNALYAPQEAPAPATAISSSSSPSTVIDASSSSSIWSTQEFHLLQKGLMDYPADNYDSVTRYIKIAATIPTKCVRDVAYKVKELLSTAPEPRMQLHEQQQQQPPQQQQLQTTYHASLSSASPSVMHAKRLKVDNHSSGRRSAQPLDSNNLLPTTQLHSLNASNRPNQSYYAKQEPEPERPNNQLEDNSSHSTDTIMDDAHLNALLQDNMMVMNTMRSNLLHGKLEENKDSMLKFRDNCQTMFQAIGGICNTIPPLPIKMDLSLLQPSPRGALHHR